MAKISKPEASKAGSQKKKPKAVRPVGRPLVEEDKKFTEKFMTSFSNTDFDEFLKYEAEEGIKDHSEAGRRLVRLGIKLKKLLQKGIITPKDLLD